MAAIPIIALAGSLIGTGLSAFGQYRAGQAQQGAYNYNAQVAESEAGVARVGAAREEEIHREKLNRLIGTQKALYAAAGVDISSGSPLLTFMETAEEGEKEAQYIRYGGEVEATSKLNEAKLNRYYGKQASRAGTIGAGSTFLTGLSQAGLGYAQIASNRRIEKIKEQNKKLTGYTSIEDY